MIPLEGWAEEKFYSYKSCFYVLIIRATFPWKEEYREELQRYALKRIQDCRKKDPRWKNPLEIQLHWKTEDSEYKNILFSDLTQTSSAQSRKTKESGWSVDALYADRRGYWIIKVTASEPIDTDFKKQIREYVFTQTRIQGLEDPIWIELQYSHRGSSFETFLVYEARG